MRREANVHLDGRSICEGLAIGQAFVYRENLEALANSYWIEAGEVEEQLRRIERAAEAVAQDLRVSARRIEADTNERLAAIFEAHEAMLQDPGFREEVRLLVETELLRAEHALAQVLRRREQQFRNLAEPAHRQHADDVADLAQRLLREMAGVKVTALERMPPGRVLVARRLLPSDTVALPERGVAGIVAEFGGPGSHVALLAEALEIPTVAQIPDLLNKVEESDTLLVDGFGGGLVINPDAATRAQYLQAGEGARARQVRLIRSSRQPACTRDGTNIMVMANVSRHEDTSTAGKNGADGVGLCRLEGFYMSRRTPPAADELLAELRVMFLPMAGKPLTIRLLDIGGDKPVPFLKLAHENNPFLGQRGVRILLRYPELLDAQLQALCQFSREQDARILVPMVTFAEEVSRVRERLTLAAKKMGIPRVPPLGAMIETPGAALSIPEIRAHADFLSIGTNDLTQYTFAAGRENPLVDEYFRESHPALLRLVRMIVDEAGGLPVAVCGELARQPEAIPTLLGLGIRTLSVAAPMVPAVKECIRGVEL
ncbi:MAG TPA: phosphoenolpyruvate--protein phosphotransferase [Clostridia bacterium]|nr:phosphoenolpyruvate--protein phosphotransferase [Clostridia bacterium]